MAREPGIQMGPSDAGAHLRNMAFYNMGRRPCCATSPIRDGHPVLTITPYTARP